MTRLIALLLANFFVVDYGVAPDVNDNSVYVIQIEPEVADQLVAGYVIESVIPPELRGIRKFRIQIGEEKLIKPIELPPALERKKVVPEAIPSSDTPDAVVNPINVPAGEGTGFDVDSFPLRPDAGDAPLIPEELDSIELPGNPVESSNENKVTGETLEPEVTPLPLFDKTGTAVEVPGVVVEPIDINNNSNAEHVVVPVFDKTDVGGVVENSDNIEENRSTQVDLSNIAEAENRIVLDVLPDLSVESEDTAMSLQAAGLEPELLEDDAANFVRLASTSSDVESISSSHTKNAPPSVSRSWPLFTITLLGLLVSVGGNVYLGMTVLDFYRKRHGASLVSDKSTDTVS
ncbi:MAG: hypothetical protein HOB73_06025 [Planctomycetaceae bacterium]|jgi:hypothetical protein|nr:hypothetical protein [Planctomycetaceae bacterium]